jgi:hypothetical protein
MTPYTLPEPALLKQEGRKPYFTADQMHAAFAAGAASRDGEIEALRADAARYRNFINDMCAETFDTWTTGYRMQQIALNIQAIAAEATK